MLSRFKQEKLLEFLSDSSVSGAGFQAVDHVVPEFASQQVLTFWRAFQVPIAFLAFFPHWVLTFENRSLDSRMSVQCC